MAVNEKMERTKGEVDIDEIIEKGKQGKLSDKDYDLVAEEIGLDRFYDTLEEYQNSRYLNSAARTSRARAHEH